MDDDQVVVIGNGESRRSVDINMLTHCELIGCNAIHRDITVGHLICCDHRMVREALNNPSTKNSLIYVRLDWYHYFRKILKNKHVNLLPTIPYQGSNRADNSVHWGSGPYAVLLAAVLGYKKINMIGFDLYGVNDKVNNIYKDTTNYSKSTKRAVDHSYWVYQISRVFEQYPQTLFKIYNTAGWTMPDVWNRKNVEKLNIDIVNQLNNNYNNT